MYCRSIFQCLLLGWFLHVTETKRIYPLKDFSEGHSENVSLLTRLRRGIYNVVTDFSSWFGDSYPKNPNSNSRTLGRRVIFPNDTRLEQPDVKDSQLTRLLNQQYYVKREEYRKQKGLQRRFKGFVPMGCILKEDTSPPNNKSEPKTPRPTTAPPNVGKRRKRDSPDNSTVPTTKKPDAGKTDTPKPGTTTTTTTQVPLKVICPPTKITTKASSSAKPSTKLTTTLPASG